MQSPELGHDLLRILIDHLPDNIYVKDATGRYVLDNAAHQKFLGVQGSDTIVGKTVYDFFPKELADSYHQDDDAVLQSGQPMINHEEPIVDNMGRRRWVSTTKTPLRDAAGQIIGLAGISRDITPQKRAQEERDRFFTLTPDMLCIAGFDGYFKELNPAWEKTLGYSAAELMRRPFLEFVHPDDRSATVAETLTLVEGSMTTTFENRYRCHDGTYKWLLWSAYPYAEQELIYAAARDITDRRESEDRLRRANEELERSDKALREAMASLTASHEELMQAQMQLIQAEKMDSVGRLAAGVAHEVKNPLAILMMGIDYLAKACPASTAGEQASTAVLKAMRDAITRADSIVRGLVDFSASRRMELGEQDLNTVVQQSLLLVKHELVAHHVALGSGLGQNLPPVRLDANKVQQVFVNVFINAIQAMQEGGTLTVRTSATRLGVGDGQNPRRAAERLAERAAERFADRFRAGDTVVLAEVEDTGPGVPGEKMDRIFDPFFTTKPPGKGTGLGLTVARKIVELNGGAIEIGNREEGGARVIIMFKAAAPAPAAPP